MAGTRTWLTTPVGEAPIDDAGEDEYWVPGPRLPEEPRPPQRFRGVVILVIVLVAVVGLTFLLAPAFLEAQDPTFGGEQPQGDAIGAAPTAAARSLPGPPA